MYSLLWLAAWILSAAQILCLGATSKPHQSPVDTEVVMIIFSANMTNVDSYKPFSYFAVEVPTNENDNENIAYFNKMKTISNFFSWFFTGNKDEYEGKAVFYDVPEPSKSNGNYLVRKYLTLDTPQAVRAKKEATHTIVTTDEVVFSKMTSDDFAEAFSSIRSDIVFAGSKTHLGRAALKTKVMVDGHQKTMRQCDVPLMSQYYQAKKNSQEYDFYVDPSFFAGKAGAMKKVMQQMVEFVQSVGKSDKENDTDYRFLFYKFFDDMFLNSQEKSAGKEGGIKIDKNSALVMNAENYWHIEVPRRADSERQIILPPLYQFFVNKQEKAKIRSVNCHQNLSCCGPPDTAGKGFDCCYADTLKHISAAFVVKGCDILIRHPQSIPKIAEDEQTPVKEPLPEPRVVFAVKIPNEVEEKNSLKLNIKAAFEDTCSASFQQANPEHEVYDVLSQEDPKAQYKPYAVYDSKIETHSMISSPVNSFLTANPRYTSPLSNLAVIPNVKDEKQAVEKDKKEAVTDK